jgi:hypothetical protein
VARVPPNVIAPAVAEEGVSPVPPAEKVETPEVPEATSVPADKVNPDPTVISSAAPVPPVDLPSSFAVAIVKPLAEAYALGAT